MGSIIGGVFGMMGAQAQADATREAAQIQAAAMDRAGERAMTGYKYLTEGEGKPYAQTYMNTGINALAAQSGVQNTMLGLLGLGQHANVGAARPTTGAFAPAATGQQGQGSGQQFQPWGGNGQPGGHAAAPGAWVGPGGAAGAFGAIPGIGAIPGQLANYLSSAIPSGSGNPPRGG